MVQIYVKYNPYRMETQVQINGNLIATDSTLYKITKGKRLQEWIGDFPQKLVEELNTVDFDVYFHGMSMDWDDVEEAFHQALEKGIIKSLSLKYTESGKKRSYEDIKKEIVKIFTELQEGPIDNFRAPNIVKAFNNVNSSIFQINVIATMSSGKSTLINALLGKQLMPSKNAACTATITEILDNDDERFVATVYDENDTILGEVSELTYEKMEELNNNDNVHRIAIQGNIPFIEASSTALMLVDTPGPNNSQNQAHKNLTYKAINNDSNSLILYVLNGTQLSTNDDASLLSYVAEQMKKGGKQVRDRFLFIVNKMDEFDPETEKIDNVIEQVKNYLAQYGIEDPQIFPCSAFTALNIKTSLDGINIDTLTITDQRKLPMAARETLLKIDKFIGYKSMYLEQYSTLSPSAKQELDYKLTQAENTEDTKEQALIHCGIYSIEAAITAYVKKYAETKKINDLVETFQEVLESEQVLAKAKTQVAIDEEVAKAAIERSAAIKAKIEDGKEAAKFKRKIYALNPMGLITEKAVELREEASKKASRIFEHYGDTITNREEAKRLVSQFGIMASDSIAELTSELESTINREIIEVSENLLKEYQERLEKMDEDIDNGTLDFGTADLVKGALNNMRESITAWYSDDFAAETVDNVGNVTYEEREYYKKVGQEAEEVMVGIENVKIGTKKVKCGSHREKVGSKTVRNPNRKGFWGFFKFWEDKYIDEDIYETVDDYKDEDVYEAVAKYETVMKDIFEKRYERIEKFSIKVSEIQTGIVSEFRKHLDEGINKALQYAENEISEIKLQFSNSFDELDKLIKQKYDELNVCASDEETKLEKLKQNKNILRWIEENQAEIDAILNI